VLIDQVDPWLEISTQHLRNNLAEVRARVGEVPEMAVVKCNAMAMARSGAPKRFRRWASTGWQS